ncbi:SPOR domain-containing protein [Marinicella sediminis]|uniref:SPOR domain-containing protein n=1 Tax=Marinicella sediminis TaxID=1792834 RepID=A0ABV7JEY1_9GAMM|nr:SPOR domain-containing protein [Marinicella sediminis]
MDQELKQRMIGASVIIALAVIFVPMLFDGNIEEKHNKNISINIPQEPDNGLEVKKFDIDKPVAQKVELPPAEAELAVEQQQAILIPKETNEPVEAQGNIETTVANTVDSSATVAEQPPAKGNDQVIEEPPVKKPAPEPVVAQTEVAKPVETTPQKPIQQPTSDRGAAVLDKSLTEVYRVKLGSFSQQANAERVRSSLLQNNIKAIVEFNAGLKLYRVWSQEMYQNKSRAEDYVSAVNRLKLNIGTPKVITLGADEVSAMAEQGQLGWVVQLGSFSSRDNAIELRNKVSAAGFAGFVDVVTNSKGVQLYRLRVGPLMERQDAEDLQQQIKTRLKLDGLVKSHELGTLVN